MKAVCRGKCFSIIEAIRTRKNETKRMRNLLYILAFLLILGWVLAVFAWNATGMIHILIVLAVIAFLLGIIRKT
jgi:predicted nucleic acid-binding Zn ribbon protein